MQNVFHTGGTKCTKATGRIACMKESIYHPLIIRERWSGISSNEIIKEEKIPTELSEEGMLLGLWNSLA